MDNQKKMKTVILLIVGFILLFFWGNQCYGDSLIVSGTTDSEDARINSHSGNAARRHTNYGGYTTFEIGAGETQGCFSVDDQNRTVIWFDISGMPAEKTIDSAFCRLYCQGAWKKSGDYGFYKLHVAALLMDWDEGTRTSGEWSTAARNVGVVTYSHHHHAEVDTGCPDSPAQDSCWHKDGADSLANDRQASVDFVTQGGSGSTADSINIWRHWDVTSVVEDWYDGTITNYGLVFWHEWVDDTCNTYIFRSSEYSGTTYDPVLSIYYNGEPPPPYRGVQPVVDSGEVKSAVTNGELEGVVE